LNLRSISIRTYSSILWVGWDGVGWTPPSRDAVWATFPIHIVHNE